MKMELANTIDRHQNIWQAHTFIEPIKGPMVTTGHKTLNQILNGGWPLGKSIELLSSPDVDELTLVMSALATLSKTAKWIAFIAPPFIPYGPAFEAAGVDTSKILMVHPKNIKEHIKANEQALNAGTCSAVISWLGEHSISDSDSKRLQQATEKQQCLHIQMRHKKWALSSSPAAFRLELTNKNEGLDINIIKQPNNCGQLTCHVSRSKALIQRPKLFVLNLKNKTAPPHPKANYSYKVVEQFVQ